MIYRFTVIGPPRGKERPRVTRYGTFTPKRTKQYEHAVKLVARMLLPHDWPMDRSYRLHVAFTGRSDVDNVLKAVADALQGVCYINDRQVAKSMVERLPPSKPPRTEITIEVLED